MKIRFFKEYSKLLETTDQFIIETDQFELSDSNGNTYDLDSREGFLGEKDKGSFALHTHGSGLHFKYLNVPQEVIVKTVSDNNSSFVKLQKIENTLQSLQEEVMIYKKNAYAYEEELIVIDKKCTRYKTCFIIASILMILSMMSLIVIVDRIDFMNLINI